MQDTSKLEIIKQEVDQFLYDYQDIEVNNQDDFLRFSDTLKIVSQKAKKLEEKRVEWTKPLLDHKKKIDDEFKLAIRPLEEFVEQVKAKMLAWKSKEQKRLDEEQKKIEAEAMKQAKEMQQSEVVVPVVNNIKTQKGEYSTATVKKNWTFEVVNENEVPRQFLMVDEKKIKQAIKDGERLIGGVRIYQEETLSIR